MTQRDVILQHLKDHKTITSWQAIMEYGITRLATRIWELKNDHGYDFYTEYKSVKTRLGKNTSIAVYSFPEDAEAAKQLKLFT